MATKLKSLIVLFQDGWNNNSVVLPNESKTSIFWYFGALTRIATTAAGIWLIFSDFIRLIAWLFTRNKKALDE